MAARTAKVKLVKEGWTIIELAELVVVALAGNFDGVGNGRVRDVPDLRAIRYYTTIGLLDRPAEMRGRTAYYGRRHLLQLVAIKRLQAQRLSLAEVQERLLGINDRELERLAEVNAELRPSRAASTRSSERTRAALSSPTPPRHEEFWKSSPALAAMPAASSEERQAQRPGVVTLVPLAAGLSVGIEACRAMTADDIAALQAAADPVRQILMERRLIRPDLTGPDQKRGHDDQSNSDTDSR
jgi:DNA-binding transcriptional MerR regulator